MPNLAFHVLAVCAGASLALQQVLNANLRTALGSPWWAGVTSYVVGLSAMVALAASAPRPSLADVSRTTPVLWSGGAFGAVFVISAILAIPRLGAATVLALVVVGQMLASLAFDHLGLLGLERHSATPIRVAGAGLLLLGVVLVRA